MLAYTASGHSTRVNYYSNPEILYSVTDTPTGKSKDRLAVSQSINSPTEIKRVRDRVELLINSLGIARISDNLLKSRYTQWPDIWPDFWYLSSLISNSVFCFSITFDNIRVAPDIRPAGYPAFSKHVGGIHHQMSGKTGGA